MDMRHTQWAVEKATPLKDAASDMWVTITSARVDRHGDRLEPEGMQYDDYMHNPVVQWAHNYDLPPIGKVVAIDPKPDRVRARIQFADTPMGAELRYLYAEGFLRAFSVGLLPTKYEPLEDDDGNQTGYHVTEWELLELSAVPVPANPDALAAAIDDGNVTEPMLVKSLGRDAGDAGEAAASSESVEKRLTDAEKKLSELRRAVEGLQVGLMQDPPDDTRTRSSADEPEPRSEQAESAQVDAVRDAVLRVMGDTISRAADRALRKYTGRLER